ncbi:MAG: cytochrome P450 [Deinococcales bacterium]
MHEILSHDTYTKGVPHAAFKALRDQSGIPFIPEPDGRGFWAITRYDDVLEVSKNPQIFSSAHGIRLEDMNAEENEARRTMMELDPPQHTAYRRLVQPPFSRREVLAYEGAVRLLAKEVIENICGTPEFDFVQHIARELPMRMLGSLLGVPDQDGHWLVEKGDALIGNTDPEFTQHVIDQTSTEEFRLMPFRSPAGLELFRYAGQEAAHRRKNPKNDLITRLLEPKIDGQPLSDQEFKNFFTLLVAAGNDTTRYTMAAGLEALIQHPEQLETLRQDLNLMDTAVEEILRWGSVTMHFRRTAIQDTVLAGTPIKSGDKVVMFYIAANFDERQFAHPNQFDIRRTPNEHLAFGLKSPHKCLGEHLARLEIKVLFEELLPRVKAISLNGKPERLRSNFISGIKHLPVRVDWV